MADEKKKEKKAKPEVEAVTESTEPKAKVRKELKPKVPTEWERRYLEVAIPKLRERFGYKNVMQIPKLEKIVINTSFKEALQDVKQLLAAADEIGMITGQKPAITKAKKSISNFKLRKGQPIGAKVTLRGASMYEFLNRFVNVALPRVRDFKGVPSNSFDGKGNYTMGLTEQTIFPEINFDKVTRLNGMNLTFVTTAKTDEESAELLKLMGMPFRNA